MNWGLWTFTKKMQVKISETGHIDTRATSRKRNTKTRDNIDHGINVPADQWEMNQADIFNLESYLTMGPFGGLIPSTHND